jgi:hypothetical protein
VVGKRVQPSINDLGENCADCKITCVSLNHCRANRVEMPKYGCLRKLLLWHIEGHLVSGICFPIKLSLFFG